MSKDSEIRRLGVLTLLNKSMCNWSDDEWKNLEKAYAKTCKK